MVTAKIAVIETMLANLAGLPKDDLGSFLEDSRTPAAAESFLRRALEALLDLGRHLLAQGFGTPVHEYAAIADKLREAGVLGDTQARAFRKLAKYRNRMVHFYDEVTDEELHDIVTQHLGDFQRILRAISAWLGEHPERVKKD